MKHKIRYALAVVIAVVLGGIGSIVPSSHAIMKTVGSQVQCDTALTGCQPFPTNISAVCSVSCPFAGRVAPSLVSAARMWGSRDNAVNACRTSVDGGMTWANCTTNAFSDTGGGEMFAEASDGSVIAMGRTAAGTTCLISRSINNATSWSSVHTFVPGGSCAQGAGEGTKLFCLTDGRCEGIVAQSTVFIVFRSTDNGSSWSSELIAAPVAVITGGPVIWDGSRGIAPSISTIASTRIGTSSSGDSWTISGTAWGGTQGTCWGAVVYNAVPYAVCQGAGATPDGRYTLRVGDTGANFASLTLPSALITSTDAGGIGYGYATNTLFIAATTMTGTYGVYASRDNLATFAQLGVLPVVGAGLRGGSMFSWNGCIYVSYGLTTAGIAKIC